MKQKYSLNIADVQMNIACEESREVVDSAAGAVDEQIRALIANKARFCTKTEAALLTALDYCTRCIHLQDKIRELEELVHTAGPGGGTPYETSLLRGENETLRAELQISRGTHDALLQDNAILFRLNGKLARQNGEANARADRMHDQVVSILTEVRDLRNRLTEAEGQEIRELSASYGVYEPEPTVEITDEEQQTVTKYEQMDLDDIIRTAPKPAARPVTAAPHDEEEVEDEIEVDAEEADTLQ
ncbi:MAG: cell division protein ZapA [Clostridia bacterium]|nr:cell division protein ZapA [Clostridia bacterium]